MLWLVPTLGLFLTSLLDPSQFTEQGWWNIISKPSLATLDNYDEVFNTQAITSSLWTTVLISVGGTILPIFVAAMAGYAFAWLDFPGRDWLFIARDRDARRADPDGADPDLLALLRRRPLRHGARA